MSKLFDRREFIKLLSVASAGALTACSSGQRQKLIPYVIPPEDVIPGVATWYKSLCRECPAGCGTLVRTREGRVVKVEGNPGHPVNRGTLCARGQAATQGLYNPDRIAQPLRRKEEGKLEPIPWYQAEASVANLVRYLYATGQGDRIVLVSERVTGSTQKLLRDWLDAVGSPHLVVYEAFAYEALRAGNRIIFGTSEIPYYEISRARFLLSFGADFLETWISNVELARQFSEMRRRFEKGVGRFIHVGPRLSLTAANADEWMALKPGSEMFLALGLVREVINSNLQRISESEANRIYSVVAPYKKETVEERTGVSTDRIESLAQEFAGARPGLALGPGVAESGPFATALQVAVNLLNYVCGNVGQTIHFGRGADWDNVATEREMFSLLDAMRTDQVALVIFHRVNPAMTMPKLAGFDQVLARVPFKISFSPFMDETSAQCDLILPDSTPLERWEDHSPRAGVYGLVQPAMAPGFAFQSRQIGDFLLAISPQIDPGLGKKFNSPSFLAYIQEQWKPLQKRFAPDKPFNDFWRESVEAGGVWEEVPDRKVRLSEGVDRLSFEGAATAWSESEQGVAAGREFHLVVYPSLQLFDGRGANRPWLQETPEVMTKIVWDSWAEVHPETASQLGVGEGDLLKLTSNSGTIQIAAHLYEGIRPDTIAVPLGQGHTSFGRWAQGRGPSPLELLPALTEAASGGLLWGGTRVGVEKLAVNRPLVRTQIETTQHDREIAQVVPLTALLSGSPLRSPSPPALSMYPPHTHPVHRWGMAIDLNACVGCNACIVACYAENNVYWVGKEQVARGRHMAWIRVDRYFEHPDGKLQTRFLVMPCQQCGNAPCESVCPVYATYHNDEGLNVQVYNRCVGTRYCSNNCPYKVRRFNWFDFDWPWPMQLGLNPDLSARSKGVMEKCTFCIQRIRAGEDHALDEHRSVRDGEITPACAQTCPTHAIVFGDLKDPSSRVSQLSKDPRGYHVLAELNTRPAVTYLKKVTRAEEG